MSNYLCIVTSWSIIPKLFKVWKWSHQAPCQILCFKISYKFLIVLRQDESRIKKQFITWKATWLTTCRFGAHNPSLSAHLHNKYVPKALLFSCQQNTWLANSTQRMIKCVLLIKIVTMHHVYNLIPQCTIKSWHSSWLFLTTKQKKKLIWATSVMVSLPTVRSMASWSLAAG